MNFHSRWPSYTRREVEDHACRQVSNQTQVFLVEIRSMGTADADNIKRLLQAKYEVKEVREAIEKRTYTLL